MSKTKQATAFDHGFDAEPRNSILSVAMTAHYLSRAQAERGNEPEKSNHAEVEGGTEPPATEKGGAGPGAGSGSAALRSSA